MPPKTRERGTGDWVCSEGSTGTIPHAPAVSAVSSTTPASVGICAVTDPVTVLIDELLTVTPLTLTPPLAGMIACSVAVLIDETDIMTIRTPGIIDSGIRTG